MAGESGPARSELAACEAEEKPHGYDSDGEEIDASGGSVGLLSSSGDRRSEVSEGACPSSVVFESFEFA